MTTLLWLKAFHLIFMVAWFAGIFYLPRLFVYHASCSHPESRALLKTMERRLLYFVTPFAVLTVLLGLALIHAYGADWFRQAGWLHAKLVLVIALLFYHGYCFRLLADFRHDRNRRPPRFYRIFNELPVVALFGIIILAVLKPG